FCVVSDFISFFFFQAEDGIRDRTVTGVQTCALPIFAPRRAARAVLAAGRVALANGRGCSRRLLLRRMVAGRGHSARVQRVPRGEIGRASCRERVSMWGVGGAWR